MFSTFVVNQSELSSMYFDYPPTKSNFVPGSPSSASNHQEANDRTDTELTDGEVMRIELYEEIPQFDREIVVREKVQIKKILIQESADAQP